ncbi:hypothetical protein GG344DRAFT_67727 [Lentinula edodes]|nr:hypothetical protein GG344DRAFT_67727 [Lentinula edodes]
MVKFSPNELLLGAMVNTHRALVADATLVLPQQQVEIQTAYVAQQQLDGYGAFMQHVVKRKGVFDRRALKKKGKEVVFEKGMKLALEQQEVVHQREESREYSRHPMHFYPRISPYMLRIRKRPSFNPPSCNDAFKPAYPRPYPVSFELEVTAELDVLSGRLDRLLPNLHRGCKRQYSAVKGVGRGCAAGSPADDDKENAKIGS